MALFHFYHRGQSQLDVFKHALVQLSHDTGVFRPCCKVDGLTWEVQPHTSVTSMGVELAAKLGPRAEIWRDRGPIERKPYCVAPSFNSDSIYAQPRIVVSARASDEQVQNPDCTTHNPSTSFGHAETDRHCNARPHGVCRGGGGRREAEETHT